VSILELGNVSAYMQLGHKFRAAEDFMRQLIASVVIVLATASAGSAQDNGLKGVYGPGQSSPPPSASSSSGPVQGNFGGLKGIYGPGQSAAPPTPPAASASAPSDGAAVSPAISFPGSAAPGQSLPLGVNPTPLPDQPGYGTVIVNGHHAIVERGTNRIYRYLD
jgi:hypothetical protein